MVCRALLSLCHSGHLGSLITWSAQRIGGRPRGRRNDDGCNNTDITCSAHRNKYNVYSYILCVHTEHLLKHPTLLKIEKIRLRVIIIFVYPTKTDHHVFIYNLCYVFSMTYTGSLCVFITVMNTQSEPVTVHSIVHLLYI